MFHVALSSASGEIHALTSQNKAYVERVVSSINKADACFRRDQRAFLLHFTGRCSAKSPHDRTGSVPQKSAPVTSCISNAE
jgi:hypothetical protein